MVHSFYDGHRIRYENAMGEEVIAMSDRDTDRDRDSGSTREVERAVERLTKDVEGLRRDVDRLEKRLAGTGVAQPGTKPGDDTEVVSDFDSDN
jgi:hypothetical protein